MIAVLDVCVLHPASLRDLLLTLAALDAFDDFVSNQLAAGDIEVITPGTLVERLLDEAPEIVVLAVQHMVTRWVNPPRSFVEIVSLLSAHPSLATAMARLRDIARMAD